MRPHRAVASLVLAVLVTACRVTDIAAQSSRASHGMVLAPDPAALHARPLERLTLDAGRARTILVRDAAGRPYARGAGPRLTFVVGGALGTQHAIALDARGRAVDSIAFDVDATTHVRDGGRFGAMFDLVRAGLVPHEEKERDSVVWQGRTYHWFVPWMLDHAETQKGMQYFSGIGGEFVDLMSRAQRPDGLIWSFVMQSDGPGYFDTAYERWGYVRRDGRVFFARQPVENHPEFEFVNAMYRHWKGSADEAWMRAHLEPAIRALQYGITDPARFSRRFQLLKRGYTVDTWDFALHDAYSVDLGIGGAMLIDTLRTKFGIFFGDNTGYAQACEQLAEMLEHAGRGTEAMEWRARGRDIRERITRVAWNGRFFTHHIEEDSTVHRDLGVDEASQLSLSNAYSLNRGIPQSQAAAIVRTYETLSHHLPPGSPGEWYAIYPPFERGLEAHDAKWQYMNGGVGGHVAGELARGALTHGFETYGADVLLRLDALARRTGGRISFAYTGSIPASSPPPVYAPVSIAPVANMDLWDTGAPGVLPWMNTTPGSGDDLRPLPVGDQTFAGIPFRVVDPARNGRRAVIAVSPRSGFPREIAVTVHATAGSVYLLHTIWKHGPEGIGGAVEFRYEDGTRAARYVMNKRDASMYWFPELTSDHAGIAWKGPNRISKSVGVFWAAIDNPHPERRIASVAFLAPADDGIYAVLGLTLADRPHYVPPNPVSFGGPDRWASSTAMAALLEGLAGVTDDDVSFRIARVAPRWAASGADSANVVVRYGASSGYVAYRYWLDRARRVVSLELTGSGDTAHVALLLPSVTREVPSAMVDGVPTRVVSVRVESSRYATLDVALTGARRILVSY